MSEVLPVNRLCKKGEAVEEVLAADITRIAKVVRATMQDVTPRERAETILQRITLMYPEVPRPDILKALGFIRAFVKD